MRTFTGSFSRLIAHQMLAITVGLVLLATPTSGYGNGAPSKVCTTQKPGHGAQMSMNPYSIDVSTSTYKAGSMVTGKSNTYLAITPPP